MALTSRHRVFPSVLFGLGLVLVYVGERILAVGKPSATLTIAGLVLLLAATGARAHQAAVRPAGSRHAERSLLLLQVVGLVAIGLFFLGSDLLVTLTGKSLEQRLPRLAGAVAALWPALLFTASLPLVFVELSLASMARAPIIDQGRVRSAMLSALGTSFALVFAFAFAYVASERNVKFDLSYFRTARAGEATKKLVRALDKPVKIVLFFPPANEVAEEVESYFADLTRESKLLAVEHYDHALHPAKARELNVSGNGIVVVSRDAVREQIAVPLTIEAARMQLRVLDQEVHKRIIGVSRGDRVAYFTFGHEERTFDPAGDTDKRSTIRYVRDLLVDQGFEPKELGMAQGLGTEVPNDAALVIIAGPRKPFLKEEMDALLRYLDRKGRLLIALDPDAGVTLDQLLGALALKYRPVTLANDKIYWNRTYQKADRINIATGSYSSHTSVSTIGRMGTRAPVVMVGAGHLEKDEKGAVGLVNVDFTVHADGATWDDKDGDYEHTAAGGETRKAYELAAAVSKRTASALDPEDEGRAVVLADSDAMADVLFRGMGNAYLVLDAIRWLSGDSQITGTITNEEDVPIQHTRKQDQAWFYSTIFVVPALVLGLGFAMSRRRRARKASPISPPAAPAPTEGTP